MGELIFEWAYFARTLFFSLQIKSPMAGLSSGVLRMSSTIATYPASCPMSGKSNSVILTSTTQ